MNRFLLSASVLTLLAGTATAADLPTMEAPMEAPVVVATPVWTGAYIGAQLGYAWGDSEDDDSCFEGKPGTAFGGFFESKDGTFDCDTDFDEGLIIEIPLAAASLFGDDDDDDDDDDGESAFFAGAHIGYDHQIGSFVLGAVADVNFIFGDDDDDDDDDDDEINLDDLEAIDDGEEFATVDFENDSDGIDWFGTARLRAGFAAGRFLVYGTGGLAFGDSAGSSNSLTVTGSVADEDDFFVNDEPIDADEDCEETSGGGFRCDFDDDDDDDDINVGYALGAGVDFLATNNFKIGVEYLYVNLGDDDDDDDEDTTVRFFDGTELTFEGEDGGDADFHTISVRGAFKFGG